MIHSGFSGLQPPVGGRRGSRPVSSRPVSSRPGSLLRYQSSGVWLWSCGCRLGGGASRVLWASDHIMSEQGIRPPEHEVEAATLHKSCTRSGMRSPRGSSRASPELRSSYTQEEWLYTCSTQRLLRLLSPYISSAALRKQVVNYLNQYLKLVACICLHRSCPHPHVKVCLQPLGHAAK